MVDFQFKKEARDTKGILKLISQKQTGNGMATKRDKYLYT